MARQRGLAVEGQEDQRQDLPGPIADAIRERRTGTYSAVGRALRFLATGGGTSSVTGTPRIFAIRVRAVTVTF